MITIRVRGSNTLNYDYDFEVDDQDLSDDEATQLALDYYYDQYPREVDTDGFNIKSIDVKYPDEEEKKEDEQE